mgnify:CR=1 FL=1
MKLPSVPITTPITMIDLTKVDLANFKIDYTALIVDNMSHTELISFALEMIYDSLNNLDAEQMEEDIIRVFGEEKLQELISKNEFVTHA